jgi:hypothetical protein
VSNADRRVIDNIADLAGLIAGAGITLTRTADTVTIGASGTAGDLSFTFTQSTPSASWTIAHGMGKHPSVTVTDSSGAWVVGDVFYIDANTLRIDFSGGFSGSAYLN